MRAMVSSIGSGPPAEAPARPRLIKRPPASGIRRQLGIKILPTANPDERRVLVYGPSSIVDVGDQFTLTTPVVAIQTETETTVTYHTD